MKQTIFKSMALMVLVLVLVPGVLIAATGNGLGQSGGHDLDDLWAKAQTNYDLEKEDAILLLETKQVTFSAVGEISTRVHSLVWIGTTVGIGSYADLRVPWNIATSTLDVEILRTWRDGRWWPDADNISDTAVVHTLPHALDKAADYTTMRETMLLHDGVELGCIMETAYTIVERDVPGRGGIFIVPRNDPAVLVELTVSAPPGVEILHEELNGPTTPEALTNYEGTSFTWAIKNVPSLRHPVTLNPETYEPAIAWSTWKDWQTLADYWNSKFNEATSLDPEQVNQFMKKLNPAMSSWQKIVAIGDYLNEMVRRVHYDDQYWQFAPRTASQTLSTAYGHDLDRAVLAATLLKAAGFDFSMGFAGHGYYAVSRGIPRLYNKQRIRFQVRDVMNAYLDPNTGKVTGFDAYQSHPGMTLATVNKTGGYPYQLDMSDRDLNIAISVEQGSDKSWLGSGYYQGSSNFSPYSKILKGQDLRTGFTTTIVESVLPGAEITSAQPVKMSSDFVHVSFDLKIDAPDTTYPEVTKFVVGTPEGGIFSLIPNDVHLYDQERSTAVWGINNYTQVVTVRIKADPEQIIHQPDPVIIKNKAGSFELEVIAEDGWLTLTRTLTLMKEPDDPREVMDLLTIEAVDWPDLRELLLEEADSKNGTIWLK